MFEQSNLMNTSYLLEKSLDVESLRRKVISNNIANVDVPHFKRSEVNFESEVKRAIQQRADARNSFQGLASDGRHIPFNIERDLKGVQPRVNLDYSTSYRNDGNNVDIEKEMVDSAKNLMRYNAFVTSLSHNYRMLKMVSRAV
ncbi:MAG TPA: flagellar basal body rod protein FlgB [Spirochaetota bacterium]|nr:flagellar basal body rod protein FlgB [Spirochaetota bacterium]